MHLQGKVHFLPKQVVGIWFFSLLSPLFRLMTTLGLCINILDIMGLKCRFVFNLGLLFQEFHQLGALPYTIQFLQILMRCLSLPLCRKNLFIHLQGREKIRIKKLQALKAHLIQGESSLYLLMLQVQQIQLSITYLCGEILLKLPI